MQKLIVLLVFALALSVRGQNPTTAESEAPLVQNTGDIVTLEPFIIDGYALRDTSWKYASIPGFEILSQGSDRETREVIGALWRGRQLALPPAMRTTFDVPMTVVIFDQPPFGPQPGGLDQERKPGEFDHHWTNVIKRTLADRESFAINLWGSKMRYSPTFRFDLFTLFQRKAPAPPSWLREGLFGGFGIYREGIGLDDSETKKDIKQSNWCSKSELREIVALALKDDLFPPLGQRHLVSSEVAPFITPLETIFNSQPPPEAAEGARWRCTASLFVRWAIYSDPATETAFWKFAEIACSRPVSEDLFRQYFGKSYRQVRAELSWYVVTAVTQYSYSQAILEPLPKIHLEPAKISEVARVLGEWERMEAEMLEAKLPVVAQNYRTHAAEKLQRSYTNRFRPPSLVATLGLLMVDTGQWSDARVYLEEAVAGNVRGPRAYVELAQLKITELRSRPPQELVPEDWNQIVSLLLKAERRGPPMRITYRMIAEVAHQASTEKPALRSALERGVGFFPYDHTLKADLDRVMAMEATSGASHNGP